MPWLFSKPFKKESPERVREIKARFTGGYLSRNSEAFKRQMNANISHNTNGLLHRITVPTLIIAGKDDELTPPSMAEKLSSEIPASKLIIIEKGGHGLYWETPDRFNTEVIKFLKNIGI
jgi:pimeloyl-ACP methyl ester carboxylesterase